jgi:transposase
LPQGALSNYKKAPDEPDDHAIGRSRGRLTTKIHALTDQREAPVTVRLTAGQAGDNPQSVPLLDDYAAANTHHGMSGRGFGLLADKAYSHPSTRTELRCRRIKHTIPSAKTRSLGVRPKDRPVVGHPDLTPHTTGCATPSNAASTGSSSGAASRPAMTSTP